MDSTQQKLSEEKRINLLKEEGISYIERDCPWQAIGRWDEALDIKLPSGSTPKDFGHEKILDMKVPFLIFIVAYTRCPKKLSLQYRILLSGLFEGFKVF